MRPSIGLWFACILVVAALQAPVLADDCEDHEHTVTVSIPDSSSSSASWDGALTAHGFYRHSHPCTPFPHFGRRFSDRWGPPYAVDFVDGEMGVQVGLDMGEPGWLLTFAQRHHRSSTTLELGLLYRTRRPLLLWHFYGGVGAGYAFDTATPYAYVLTGTEFLIFFWESGFTFEQPGRSFSRSGLRFRF